MNRCDTCKHWEPPQTKREKMGTCLASSEGLRGYSAVSGKRLMEAVCDEDRAALATAPTFGCVHWEMLP